MNTALPMLREDTQLCVDTQHCIDATSYVAWNTQHCI